MKHSDFLSIGQARQLLLRVLDALADDLGLPKRAAPNEEPDQEAEEGEPFNQ